MQAFGCLRYERFFSRQRGRPETLLELRLEQAIECRDVWQKADAEAERKKIALRCQQAIEADALCQAAEQRRATRGPQEASLEERRRGHLADRHHVCSAARAAQQ